MTNGTRRGWGISVTHRPLFTPAKKPLPLVQEAGWAPEPVWTGAENLDPTEIRSPDRPVVIPTELPGPHIKSSLLEILCCWVPSANLRGLLYASSQ